MERIEFKGWQNCYRLANEFVELVVTADVGPRLIYFGFVRGENELKLYPDTLGQIGGEEWHPYGGHRLWHAPEVVSRTYYPDNHPVKIEQHPEFIRLIQPVEKTTGIQKEIDIALATNQAQLRLAHRLRNTNLWAVELAPWAISVMAAGGRAIIPLPPRGTHPENLLPSNTITIWAYTNLADPRWTLGHKYILLRQSAAYNGPQKIGLNSQVGWLAYARNKHLFVKKSEPIPVVTYPDLGCSLEVFTNKDMLELETLGPLVALAPETTVEHVERWFLFADVPEPTDDAAVEAHILPLIQEAT